MELLFPNTIGERIRAVRLREGLSLDRFAEVLGYSRRALINWEQNAAEPPISVLPKLRKLYDVDPEWVVLGTDLVPRVQHRATDWARFDRIVREVGAACQQIGIDFEDRIRMELARDLFDEDPSQDQANRKQLHRTLRSIARGTLK